MAHNELNGGEAVCQTLMRLGVRTVFAVAGASHTRLLDPLDRSGVQIISNRHESGAVCAADGYARVTGRLGVALVIADQGLPNAVGGIASAFHACSPVLILVARAPAGWIEAESETDNDKLELVSGVTKWARSCPSADRLSEYTWVAAKRAQSGRPGPTVLAFAGDQLGQVVETLGRYADLRIEPSRPAADAAQIRDAASAIRKAKRPMIIAGAGACWGEAGAALVRLNKQFGLPVLGNGLGRGLVPEDNETSFNWPMAQLAAKDADCVVLAGARLKQRLGFGLPPRHAANATFVQIDIDADELHRNRPADIAICADAGAALGDLADELHRQKVEKVPDPLWIRKLIEPRLARLGEIKKGPEGGIHPLQIGRAVRRLVDDNTIYVGDGADIQNWMYGAFPVRRTRGFLDHYPMGSMGVGTPLAVGAAAGAKDLAQVINTDPVQVVLVTGDGSFGFYAGELHAADAAGLPLVVIVANDGAWGSEVHEQRASLGRDVNTQLGQRSYEKIGEAFGGLGLVVRAADELEPAIRQALDHNGLAVVNVLTDPEAGAEMRKDPLLKLIVFSDLADSKKQYDVEM